MCWLWGGAFEKCCMSQHNLSFYETEVEEPSLRREFIPCSQETSLLWQSCLTQAAEQMFHWGFDRSSSSELHPLLRPHRGSSESQLHFSNLCSSHFVHSRHFPWSVPYLLHFISPLLLPINDMFLMIRVMSHSSLYHSNYHAWNKCVLNIFFMTDKCSEFWKLMHILCVLFKVSSCRCWFHGWTKVSIIGNSDACTR